MMVFDRGEDKIKIRWSDEIPTKQCKQIPQGTTAEVRTEDGEEKEVCLLAFDDDGEPVEIDWSELGTEAIELKD